jgi:crossover junction endodeoxyribonuclease RusA
LRSPTPLVAGEWPGITLIVHGHPQPKGSMRAFVRGRRPILTDNNPKLRWWQTLIEQEVNLLRRNSGVPIYDGPVSVDVTFALVRPPSLAKKVVWHTKKPDLDKLLRAVCDALTGTLLVDDNQVVRVSAFKCYAALPSGPGATIRVLPMQTGLKQT